MEILNISINLNASMGKVWQALTDASIVKQYFFGTNLTSDWKVGNPIVFEGEWEGRAYKDQGIILEIETGKYVKYSYFSSMSGMENKPENYVNISYHLSEKDGATQLIITQDGIKDKALKEHAEQTWLYVLGKMKELIEE